MRCATVILLSAAVTTQVVSRKPLHSSSSGSTPQFSSTLASSQVPSSTSPSQSYAFTSSQGMSSSLTTQHTPTDSSSAH
ncbi:hypothetical protein GCK32_009891, partial [Trichostrongylus colubriformis]